MRAPGTPWRTRQPPPPSVASSTVEPVSPGRPAVGSSLPNPPDPPHRARNRAGRPTSDPALQRRDGGPGVEEDDAEAKVPDTPSRLCRCRETGTVLSARRRGRNGELAMTWSTTSGAPGEIRTRREAAIRGRGQGGRRPSAAGPERAAAGLRPLAGSAVSPRPQAEATHDSQKLGGRVVRPTGFEPATFRSGV